MKRSILALIIIGTAFTASVAHADAKLDELVRKADMVTRSKTSAAVFEMTIKTSTYTRSFKIVAWSVKYGFVGAMGAASQASMRAHTVRARFTFEAASTLIATISPSGPVALNTAPAPPRPSCSPSA